MDQLKIVYPCWWTYALIGADEELLRIVVGEIARGFKHRAAFSKESAHKKYVSLHVEIWVSSQLQRDELFRAFQGHPHVKTVL